MTIKILNRNLQTPNDYTSAKIFQIDDGAVFTEVKNETLDSMTVIINNQNEKIEIKPYDIVEISSLTDRYLCVDTYTETMICVNPKLYKYEINLFSETKQLENIVLPNLKISSLFDQPPRSIYFYLNEYLSTYSPMIRISNGTDYNYQYEWDWSQLENKFDSIDCPEMQWNTPTLREVINDLMMIADCIPVLRKGELIALDLTESPTNNPYNALLNPAGLKDVSEDVHINYVTKSKSSEDYVSELQVKLENVTNQKPGVNNTVTRVEYVTFNISDDESTLQSSNIKLKTLYPIYNLKSLTVIFPGAIGTKSGVWDDPDEILVRGWVSQNLMSIPYNGEDVNIVYEKDQWNTKNILYNSDYPNDLRKWPKYQNCCLYYTRGNNEILNFDNTAKYGFIPAVSALYKELCRKICMMYWPQYETTPNANGYPPNYYNLLFKVEYETLDGCLFRASKNNDVEHDRVVIDNQTNSMVDSYAQGFLEYQKANRLGNEQIQINARYPADYDGHIIKIGDSFEDAIIYQCQYQYFKNHIEVNASATKDYILREYFTGVKSKIRSWKIVSGSDALIRHDLNKYYCEFSYNNSQEINGMGHLDYVSQKAAYYFCSPLYNYDANPLSVAYVRTIDDDVEPHPGNLTVTDVESQKSYYCLDLMTRIIGNSLVFTFEFLDNFWAGQSFHTENDFNGGTPESGDKYIEMRDIKLPTTETKDTPQIDSSALSGGGVPMYQHRYTDDNGEFYEIQVYYATGIKIIPTLSVKSGDEYVDEYTSDVQVGDNWARNDYQIASQTQKYLYYTYQRPRVYEGSFRWNGSTTETQYDYTKLFTLRTFLKDSQEIINLSTQYEFSTDTNDICFTKEWLFRQQAINVNSNNVVLQFKGYKLPDGQKFNFRKPDEFPSQYQEIEIINPTLFISETDSENSWIVIKTPATFNSRNDARNYLVSKANWVWYLVVKSDDGGVTQYENGEEPILLVLTNLPTDVESENIYPYESGGMYGVNLRFYLNILRVRNKNIYDEDNHYLIVDKL